jgi:ABC-2 type transport system permease protein
MSRARIAAVLAKELREYRRNRLVVGSMIVYPALFTALPIANFFARQPSVASAALTRYIGLSLLYLLIVPVVVPATISGFAIVGERDAGTLEPLLTTPIPAAEILLGKATAIAMPTLAIAYGVYGIFLLAVELFARSFVAGAVFHSNQVVAQLVFIPLLAAWSIWVGLAISTRVGDVRVAQQLTVLGSLPPVALTSLMAFGVISPTRSLAVIVAAALLAVDLAGWRLVATLFNRERLITGSTPHRVRRRALSVEREPRSK